MVNAWYNDRVDKITEMMPPEKPHSCAVIKTTDFYEGINNVLFDDDPPYKVFRLIYTSNDGSLLTSRYLAYSPCGKVVDYVMEKDDHEQSIWFAKLVLYLVCFFNDEPKAIKDAVKTRKLEEDQEICVICQEEYQTGDTIGDHKKCIKEMVE